MEDLTQSAFPLTAADLNSRSMELCLNPANDPQLAAELQVVRNHDTPATVLDFGTDRVGTIAAGILLARICFADLADVSVHSDLHSDLGLPRVQVRTDQPLSACIGGQYAGWPFSVDSYFAMCSGPARMARGQEELLTTYDLVGTTENAVGVFETNQLPGENEIADFARQCGVNADRVFICVARTASLPGTLQVVARSIETTMHKLFELGFDLRLVRSAIGNAPLPPIASDDLTALGWTNDSILYGSMVNLVVDCDDHLLDQVGETIPSNASSDYGRPFLDIFNEYDRDFYKVDKLLFSPAQVVINNLATGRTFRFGELRNDLLQQSYGL